MLHWLNKVVRRKPRLIPKACSTWPKTPKASTKENLRANTCASALGHNNDFVFDTYIDIKSNGLVSWVESATCVAWGRTKDRLSHCACVKTWRTWTEHEQRGAGVDTTTAITQLSLHNNPFCMVLRYNCDQLVPSQVHGTTDVARAIPVERGQIWFGRPWWTEQTIRQKTALEQQINYHVHP